MAFLLTTPRDFLEQLINISKLKNLFKHQKSEEKKNRQTAGRYLITFYFSRKFRSEKIFAESLSDQRGKIEPLYELSFQNVYWENQRVALKFWKFGFEKLFQ